MTRIHSPLGPELEFTLMPSTAPDRDQALRQQQAAFDDQLSGIIEEHRGEFVLFANNKVIDFFATFAGAYAAGVSSYGTAGGFIVAEVRERSTQPVSLAWDAGVMFQEL